MSHIYVFVREDLSPEQKIVQVGHACHEAGKIFQNGENIPSLVLLSAQDQEDLIQIAQRLQNRGIDFYAFYEPDFGPLGYTALCTQPVINQEDRKFFKKWRLYRHTACESSPEAA